MFSKADEYIVPIETAYLHSGVGLFVTGVSPAIRALERVISDISPTDIPILLVGESGTGKEAVALEIHRRSRRRDEAFLKCNCFNLAPDSLPTTSAVRMDGSGTRAAAGTLFLDEISQLAPADQSWLLQLLPDGNQAPSGNCLGARVISATTRNLEEEMRNGCFREELFYRINGVCLRLPSLRHRRDDIPMLLEFFLKKYASLFGRQTPQVGSQTMDLLLGHAWPGNIRELENVARKLVALGDEHLAVSDLMSGAAAVVSQPSVRTVRRGGAYGGKSLKEASREASRKAERDLILRALDRTHWNRKRTARELQISYKALLYKLKQMDLDPASDS